MANQQKFGLLVSMFMIFPTYPYNATQNSITLSAFDYSKRPMAHFFADLPIECQVTMNSLNTINKLYPVNFVITNKSEKSYNFKPCHIAGIIRTDYEQIVKYLNIEVVDIGIGLSIMTGLFGVSFGTLFGGIAGHHHINSSPEYATAACLRTRRKGLAEHIRGCRTMKTLTYSTMILGGIGLLAALNGWNKIDAIRQKQYMWLKKHGLPKEGISITPGEHVEVIVFLTEKTYDQSSIMVSLVQPIIEGGATETFNVSLVS